MKSVTALAAVAALAALVGACADSSTDVSAPHVVLVPRARATVLDPDAGAPVMTKLANPRGLAWGPEGELYVAEAGRGGTGACFLVLGQTVCHGRTGAVSRLFNGEQERIISDLPSWVITSNMSGQAEGPNSISLHGYGGAYVTIGLEADPKVRDDPDKPELREFGQLVHILPPALTLGRGVPRSGRTWEFVADLGKFETESNPDCGDIDSNPFGVLADAGGVIVADAGANAFVRRAANGELSTFAAFSNNTTVPGPGCPAAATRDFVPTSITIGPDGAYYLGHLNGLKILAGSSNVWRMERGGQPEIFRSGFTWIISLAFDPSGNLYVLQYSDGPTTADPGSLIRVTPDGVATKVISGLQRPGGVAVGPDGVVYISMVPGKNFKGDGEVRRYIIP